MQDSDTIVLSKTKFDVIPFIEEIVFEMRINCKVNIVTVSDEEELLVDRKLFKRVMQTVIKNAENAVVDSDRGRIDILIDRTGESLLICVEKTNHPHSGTNIRGKDKVLQVNGTREEIGLNDCRRIIKAHGGKIWFASRSRKETNVYIRIPV